MDHVYKVRRISDGKMYGRKPRFHREAYFGEAGKVFTRKVDAVDMAWNLSNVSPCEVLEYDVVFGRVVEFDK